MVRNFEREVQEGGMKPIKLLAGFHLAYEFKSNLSPERRWLETART